ncbi:MAG: DUF885 domain-containing protein [Rhodothermia bacterium]|nr:DUF885 domain-containing protein [Rhodothermia bacterium]
MTFRRIIATGGCVCLMAVGTGCEQSIDSSADAVQRADEIAAEYVDAYYHQFPEEAYEVGYPETPMDRFGDRSQEALAEWQAQEDAWLSELQQMGIERVRGTAAELAFSFASWRLQASVDKRVCRQDLWNVSPTFNGWQAIIPATLSQQPVDTPEARADALARIRDLPRYIDTEVSNLKTGLEQGYSAPRSNVDAVLRQIQNILDSSPKDSPFYDPAERAANAEFAGQYETVLSDAVYPAVQRYHDFLANEYRPAARTAIAVTADPGGEACYAAMIRFNTSLNLSPEQIHENGHEQMARIEAEVREIGRRSFGLEDPKELFQLVRTDSRYTFESGDEVLAYARAAVDRGKRAVPDWFGFIPEAEVIVRPFPEFMKRSGGGFYSAGATDGSRPGTYELGIYRPETISKAGIEATAFHETYPGHHMQVSVGLERAGLHPVLKYFFFSGSGEGWALYTERLADEMGLYSSDVDRLGLLSNEALRAARLVVDPGMHALGWSRQQAIDYMLDHTAESENSIVSEVDRYIATPAQATAYMTGSSEIRRLRHKAEAEMGDRFDIKVFHDKIIEDGTVTLGMLRDKIQKWIDEGV